MTFKRRVFFTCVTDSFLEPGGRDIKERILKRIRDAGYEPQLFFREGLPKNMSWSFSNVRAVMQRCSGAVVLGLPRWSFQSGSKTVLMPSEFTHYEGAVAHAFQIPVLTIALYGMPERAVYSRGGDKIILTIPSDVSSAWINSDAFNFRFSAWLEELADRRDAFLGYCSEGKFAAQALQLYLTQEPSGTGQWISRVVQQFSMRSSVQLQDALEAFSFSRKMTSLRKGTAIKRHPETT